MAGDWIKMRGGLFSSPKLIAMSRTLHANREFREWLTPGGGSEMNGQLVSDYALRCVTGALLCVTWSWSREFGKSAENGDCLLQHITIDDIDGIAGAPGVGAAMERVGWAKSTDNDSGVILPNFFTDMNIPASNAERQKAYRQRQKGSNSGQDDSESSNESVTTPLRNARNKTVTRGEEEESLNPNPNLSLGGNAERPDLSGIDWDIVTERACWIASELPTTKSDRISWARIGVLMQLTLSDAEVTDAICTAQRRRKPASYFMGTLARRAEHGGWNFNTTLRAITVPNEIVEAIPTNSKIKAPR